MADIITCPSGLQFSSSGAGPVNSDQRVDGGLLTRELAEEALAVVICREHQLHAKLGRGHLDGQASLVLQGRRVTTPGTSAERHQHKPSCPVTRHRIACSAEPG